MEQLYKNKPVNDRIILNKICFDILSTDLSKNDLWKCDKEHSNEFTFIFVDGREQEFSHLEYLAAFKSTKLFSEKNYKILVFVPNTRNFLDNCIDLENWRIEIIKIDPIKSHDDYSKFMIEKLPWLIPTQYWNLIFFQSDSFFIKNGWENYIKSLDVTYLGTAWRHFAGIQIYQNNQWLDFKDTNQVCVGNGAVSFRTLPSMRSISYATKNMILRERGTENKLPPEDLHYSFFNQIWGKLATPDECKKFSTDPIDLEDYNNKSSFACHFPKHKNEWK